MSCLVLYQGGSSEITHKKSRFIADVFPVHSSEEAVAYIDKVRKKHYDARHHCFAYAIGENNKTIRSSDDGEPSGTAGRPILDVIQGANIQDVLIVVTRYFGGTLLGTGGLVRAYSEAAKEGLKNSITMERFKGVKVDIITDYHGVGKLQFLISALNITEIESKYEEFVTVTLLVPEENLQGFKGEVTESSGGKAKINELDQIYYGLYDGNVIYLD
ncbi:MAG: YigZ family protein [Lachnoclostridium sp.]|jgi:uncharacterized YigZ family protein|nr:YigZ family protein [Lachnoclostridium sp.]